MRRSRRNVGSLLKLSSDHEVAACDSSVNSGNVVTAPLHELKYEPPRVAPVNTTTMMHFGFYLNSKGNKHHVHLKTVGETILTAETKHLVPASVQSEQNNRVEAEEWTPLQQRSHNLVK